MNHSVHHLAYEDDLAARVIEQLHRQYASDLPNWRNIILLVPHAHLRRRLLRLIQTHVRDALIPPFIGTLRTYIEQHFFLDHAIVNDELRRLILIDEIKRQHAFFPNASPWALSDALFEIFDELTLNQIALKSNLDEFVAQLEKGYGIRGGVLDGLNIEARAIHSLWIAYHQQLESMQFADANSAYCLRLQQWDIPAHRFVILDLTQYLPAELNWLRARVQENKAMIWTQNPRIIATLQQATVIGTTKSIARTDSPYSQFLDAALTPNEYDFATRARTFAKTHSTSPALGRLFFFNAESFEQEAHAIELQVRRWVLEKRKSIAIVVEDRALARRVRALLERANVSIHDPSGWALSTTSAAATLESWLQCIEEDFAHQPLLDVLKSPFAAPANSREAAVYALESDVMRYENVGRDITRYREAAAHRASRFEKETSATTEQIFELLDFVENAAFPLLNLHDEHAHSATDYLSALQSSMRAIGLETGFANDKAGVEVLGLLHQLNDGLGNWPIELNWTEFRTWLAQALESQRFVLETPAQTIRIELLTLAHCSLERFDAIVVGGLTRDYLPGQPPRSPFFNAAVRHELGLPPQSRHQHEKFHRFRSLLESAPVILLTSQHDETTNIPSPWVELLQAFHRLAYQQDLLDTTLNSWVEHPGSQVTQRDWPLPAPQTQPSVVLPVTHIPDAVSASSHQTLIDCPYAFFVGAGLKLRAPEEIRELLSKHDYGERVHTCLQAFHKGAEGFSGPFEKNINEETRGDAIAFLDQIAHEVFAADIEDSFHHRGWLTNWLERIPDYIDWQIEKAKAGWRVAEVEKHTKRLLDADLSVYGRIDRVDMNRGEIAILDYKTGTIPSQKQIENGESVQLPHYALTFADRVSRAEYVDLQKETIKSKNQLEGESFEQITEQVRNRLLNVWREMKNSTPLPAWGDDKICGYCDFSGICRKGTWDQA